MVLKKKHITKAFHIPWEIFVNINEQIGLENFYKISLIKKALKSAEKMMRNKNRLSEKKDNKE